MRAAPRRFALEVSELRRVSALVQDEAAAAGLDEDAAYRADLCVHEAVANLIRHSLAPGSSGAFEISMERADGLAVTLTDHGRPFDPLQHPAPPAPTGLDTLPVGGLGIHLMRSAADSLAYRRDGDRNVLVMRFRNRHGV